MKKSIHSIVSLSALSILLLCHWGSNNESNDSIVGGGKKPDVNFYGTVIDNTGTTVQANSITISGMYRQIPVYLEPKDLTQKEYNPSDNIARIDLAEISKISIENPEKLYTFLNRSYIEIHILSNDGVTTNKYMIETSKKIFFDEVNESGPIEREVSLTALQEVNIKGYTQQKKESQKPSSSQKVNPESDKYNSNTFHEKSVGIQGL